MEMNTIQVNQMSAVSEINNTQSKEYVDKKHPTAAEIQDWLVSYLAELLEIDQDEVDVTIPFDSYGLDSSAAIGLTGDLEDWLGCDIDPTLLYDYPTIEAQAQYLAEEFKLNM
ncbi:MAG: acyl carrier protein [Moorea sp. SIO4A3]|nr:acyl carrier protein [Moorena sp. SIO4A3]